MGVLRSCLVVGVAAAMLASLPTMASAGQPAGNDAAGSQPGDAVGFETSSVGASRDAEAAATLDAAIQAAVHGDGDGDEADRTLEEEALAQVRIIGGRPVTNTDRWPSIVSFNYAPSPNLVDGHYCGGSLIAERWVLTAVHCLWDAKNDEFNVHVAANTMVLVGRVSLEGSAGTAHRINSVAWPQGTTGANLHRSTDIAIVELDSPAAAPLVNIPPPEATLGHPPASGIAARDGNLWVTGWGLIDFEERLVTSQLMEVDVPLWSHVACAQVQTGATGVDVDSEVCADGEEGRGACSGDSGGPLMRVVDGQKWQIGVVSRGPLPCAVGSVPTIYSWTPAWFSAIRETTGRDPSQLPDTVRTACAGRAVPSAGFSDTVGNTHRDAVDCIVWNAVAQGTSASTYSPKVGVTRAQMATFIARLVEASGASLPPDGNRFSDVAGTAHGVNIERLAAAGIVQGVGGDRYSPGSPVTRGQMATFLARTFAFVDGEELPVSQTGFTDIAGTAHEANIRRVAGAGFAQGTSQTTYAPAADVRRDQMASFLARMLERFAQDGRVVPPG